MAALLSTLCEVLVTQPSVKPKKKGNKQNPALT